MPSHLFHIICALLLFIFIMIVFGAGFYIFKRYGSPFPRLFYEFDKKIWMTLGLGILFFGFYFFFVMILSNTLSSESFQKIFSLFYQYKVESIYIGLFTFSFITLTIYLARIFIKYLYKYNKTK